MSDMSGIYPAHIRLNTDGTQCIQTVSQHCEQTAKLAAAALSPARLSAAGYFAGMLHDAGKRTVRFSSYIHQQADHASDAPARGSVNHTFAAVRLLLERWHADGVESFRDIAIELLAYAVGAHHGQFDIMDEAGQNGFDHRRTDRTISYDEAISALMQEFSPDQLDEWCDAACAELEQLIDSICHSNDGDGDVLFMDLALSARLLLSAVIEGDRADTAAFMACRTAPPVENDPISLWHSGLTALNRRLAAFHSDTPLNKLRADISDQCAAVASQPGGILRLTLPTGAGKTLTSLRFSLEHALAHHKRRIIYVMPLLAIIEQNAAEIRKALDNTIPVLEHHSNLVTTQLSAEELDERELLCESWHAPLIVTSLVQLLQTLFSGKTTCIRRFQALCGSIIVIDEVQTVPLKLLSLFNTAIQFLADFCGTTVILCSATQPCLEKILHPLKGVRNLMEEDLTLRPELKRTNIRNVGTKTPDELAQWVLQQMDEVDTLLVICNTKVQARDLYQRLSSSGYGVLHLSAAMCNAHRRTVLQSIIDTPHGEKRICVSTQVMEAGVDVSFQRVIRLRAGIDSIIQAAGRCNRHGESSQPQDVYIVQLLGENLAHLEEIKNVQEAFQSLFGDYENAPAAYNHDLASAPAIAQYYQHLYHNLKDQYTLFYDVSRRCTLYDLLSMNQFSMSKHCGAQNDRYCLRQSFKLAGQLFSVFDSDTTDVIVPYQEGIALIDALQSDRAKYDRAYAASLLEQLKPYTISLYQHEVRAITELGGLRTLEPLGVHILAAPFYHTETGFFLRQPNDFLEG